MQYLVSVIDDTAGLATPDEMAAINAFNDRLKKVCHRPQEHPLHALESPIDLHTGLSRGCGSSLAGVPMCAAECRFVRVIGVLDPSRTRACVALVLAGAALVSRRACVPVPACLPAARRPGRRRPSTWSATHPATPAVKPGMTHRNERNVR